MGAFTIATAFWGDTPNDYPNPSSLHPGTINFGMMDGSLHAVPQSATWRIIWDLIGRSDGLTTTIADL